MVIAVLVAFGGLVWFIFTRGKVQGGNSVITKIKEKEAKETAKRGQSIEDATAKFSRLRKLLRDSRSGKSSTPSHPPPGNSK